MSRAALETGLRALADTCAGLDLPAAGRLASAALAAAAVGDTAPQQQLATLLSLASERDGEDDGNSEERAQLQWVQAAAGLALARQLTPAPSDSAAAVVTHLLLPLLASQAPRTAAAAAGGRQHAVVAAAAELAAAGGCWSLCLDLVQAATDDSLQAATPQLSAGVRMRLAAAVILQALPAASQQQQRGEAGPQSVLEHAAARSLPAVLSLLTADQPQQQQQRVKGMQQASGGPAAGLARVAAQLLLPVALQAACQLGQEGEAAAQLWACCKQLLEAAPQRRLGLALLLQFAAPLLAAGSQQQQQQQQQRRHQQRWGGVRADADFWRLLRVCLRDGEPANRKRAAAILQLAVAETDGQLAPAWRSFLKLLDCLEELATHLVQDGWAEIERLHPAASLEGEAGTGAAQLADAPATEGPGGSPASWEWLEVLWARALTHEYQQVQKGMLSNFLSRRWDSQQQQRQQQQQQQQQQQGLPAPRLADVPPTFVLCTLLPAAGQAHMWRGEAGCELQGQVAAWVARYVAAQQPQQAQRLLLELLDHLAASGSSVQPQRPLAQTFARALAAGAEAAAFVCEQQPAGSSSSSGSSQPQWQWQLRFLEGMQRATASLGSSWGGGSSGYSFALDISTHLLGAAAAVVQLPAGAIGPGSQAQLLAAGGAWLKQLLLAAVLPGGALHLKAAAWVRQLAGEQPAQLLATCVRHHMAPPAVGASSAAAVPDWEGWQQQAGGLARLALLLTAGGDEAAPAPTLAPADLTTAFSSWSDTLCMLYRRPYLAAGTAEHCLSLLSELQVVCLAVGAPMPAAAAAAEQAQQPLVAWLVPVMHAAADELCSYAGLAAGGALWQPQQAAAAVEHTAAAGQVARRAQVAVGCGCSGLHLLVQQQQAGATADRLVAGCLEVLHGFVAAQQQAAPLVDEQQRSAAGWQHAAAQLTALADCCHALAGAAAAGGLHTQSQAGAAQAAAASIDAALALQAEALGAAARGKGRPAAGSAAALAVYCHRLSWKAAVGLLELQQALSPSHDPQQAQRWQGQQAGLLAAALSGLRRSAGSAALASDPRGLLLQLRCCRLALPAALRQGRVARLALALRQPEGPAAEEDLQLALAAWVCGAAWQAYKGAAVATKRRRAGLTAAVVSTCLHPQLFTAASASAALHAPEGPLQQLLSALLGLGAKSWRIQSIVSLQLCGLLARRPQLARKYSPALRQLLLSGSSDDPGQSGVGDPVDADSAAELAALVAPGDAQLAAAFAASELAPRVAALSLLRSWVEAAQRAQRAQQQGGGGGSVDDGEGPAAEAAREAGLLVLRELLALAASDADLGAARYSPLGLVHRKKVRLWQAVCVLSPLVPDDEAEKVFDALLRALSAAELANVRQYIDAAALYCLRRRPELLRARVLPLLRDCSSSGSHALSSLLVLAARQLVRRLCPASGAAAAAAAGCGAAGSASGAPGTSALQQAQQQAQQQLEQEGQALLDEVVAAIVPWSLSHVHALRTFAQLLLWRLYELFPTLPAHDATAAALLRFFRENDDIKRLRRGLDHLFCFDAFDLEAAVAPAALLCAGTAVHRADAAFEGAPQPLLEAVTAFLASERHVLRQDLKESKTVAAVAELVPSAQRHQAPAAGAGPTAPTTNWQKKGGGAGLAPGTGVAAAAVAGGAGASAALPGPADNGSTSASLGPWATALGSAALLDPFSQLDAAEAELAVAEQAVQQAAGGPRQQLVVVASLLTKAPNLAGLARTCEVFRADRLVLHDLSVTRQREFVSIAVTAHHWLPLTEVPEPALATWLQAQAAQGWSLVGLEQTAESVPLQHFTFPPRTVLVLGREREGLPPHILALLHSTVEIPQLGRIRSLNVHVSGAISAWEFTRQRLLAQVSDAGGE